MTQESRNVVIRIDHLGHGTVVIDDIDLSLYIDGLTLSVSPGSMPRVALSFGWVRSVVDVLANVEADVSQMDPAAAALVYKILRRRFFGDESSAAEEPGNDGGNRGAL